MRVGVSGSGRRPDAGRCFVLPRRSIPSRLSAQHPCASVALVLTLTLAATGLLTGRASAAPPAVSAPSAAVIETSTGTVLYAKNGDQQRGMASTTKLMTALVALDEKPLSAVLRAVDYRPSAAETRIGLRAGEAMTVADLVRAMMLPSANDAAQTIAVRSAGTRSRFVAQMNAKAKQLGLTRTHFTNPVGLDAATHRTTAIELARIGAAVHDNPFLRATIRRPRITLASGDVSRTLVNRNLVLGTAVGGGGRIDGMKTGHTTASGYSLVGSATRGGLTYVSVVLGDPSETARDTDTVRLLRWGSALMVRRTLARKGDDVATVRVAHGDGETVPAVVSSKLVRAIPRGARVQVLPGAVSDEVEAPIRAGQPLGTARVLVTGRKVATVRLVAAADVARQGPVSAAAAWIGDHFVPLVLSLLLLVGGTLTIVRSRRPPTNSGSARRASGRPERTSSP